MKPYKEIYLILALCCIPSPSYAQQNQSSSDCIMQIDNNRLIDGACIIQRQGRLIAIEAHSGKTVYRADVVKDRLASNAVTAQFDKQTLSGTQTLGSYSLLQDGGCWISVDGRTRVCIWEPGKRPKALADDPSETPEAVVRKFMGYSAPNKQAALTGSYSEVATSAMRAIFSSGFVRDWEAAWALKENIFDADIFIGRASVVSTKLNKTWLNSQTETVAVVTGSLSSNVDGENLQHEQTFVFLKENDKWKIDEIIYDRNETHAALHAILREASRQHYISQQGR